ncbi:MAG: hypothetical protein MI743_07695 [Sneathiellales bacterium]|nr:hypothetical protein [Sneathiellales bacterium]
MANPTRVSTQLPAGAIHILDPQGDALTRYVELKNFKLTADDLNKLQTEICPDWLLHIVNVETENPEGFFFERYDQRCLFNGGRDLTNETMFAAGGDTGYLAGVLDTYNSVRSHKIEKLTREVVLSETPRVFLRHTIPLISKGNVKQILICSRYEDTVSNSDILVKKALGTRQKIEDIITVTKSQIVPFLDIQRRFTLIYQARKRLDDLWMNSLEPIHAGRDAFIDNLRERIGHDPVGALLLGDRLAVYR